MVDGLIDPMSVPMATTHFSQQVEQIMRSNGDNECADLCKDIRNWWESEDTAGIPANERINLQTGLRDRLLRCDDCDHFPPAMMWIKGWPIQLWEALLANIDAKALLYCLCHGGTYNVRSFSSMLGETYFSELVLNDKRGRGTVSCQEFGQFVGTTIERVQARLDPNRQANAQ
ncbi:hypothetical protein DPMN_084578 [Dreissena polymorpha]|uniref:Uncharacterized protein n=1 Tax=Dreissena polymorpha TaxID=45954 RepID=A0A9D3YAT2_DREPO|nr:hypothetical protein DPMN_084578 [Dreissena polymorpha]